MIKLSLTEEEYELILRRGYQPLVEKQKKIMLHTSVPVTSLALKTVRGFGRVGFSGSRCSGSVAAFSCSQFLASLSGFCPPSVGVGCARGVGKALFLMSTMLIVTSCKKKEDDPDPIVDTSLEVQKKLDDGADIQTLIGEYGTDDLYGKKYQGGLILHIDQVSKEVVIIAETDQSESASWGCTARLRLK